MKRILLPILLLLLGTVLAAGAGYGVTTGLGMAISLGDGQTLRDPGSSAPAPKIADSSDASSSTASAASGRSEPAGLSRSVYVSTIVGRNIFDHNQIGRESTKDDTPCVGEECELGEKTDLPLSLLATIIMEPVEGSSAIVRLDEEERSELVGVGSQILDATVLAIAADRVIVKRDDGSQEYIAQGEIKETRTSSAGTSEESDDEQIAKEGDNKYVVDRALVEETLGDLDAVSRMARARPNKDSDGNVDGFRLSGVRRNQLLYKLGIRSGDVIHSVNGQPLTSMAEAMNAYNSMMSDANFSFEISRRGKDMNMQYEVR